MKNEKQKNERNELLLRNYIDAFDISIVIFVFLVLKDIAFIIN